MNEKQHRAWIDSVTKSWPEQNQWHAYFAEERKRTKAAIRSGLEDIISGLSEAFRQQRIKHERHCDFLETRMQDETAAIVKEFRAEVARLKREVTDLESRKLRVISGQ